MFNPFGGGEIQSYTNRSYNKVIAGIFVRASCLEQTAWTRESDLRSAGTRKKHNRGETKTSGIPR